MDSAAIPILDIHVNTTSYLDTVEHVIAWAKQAESRYVCAANVHMVMEAHDTADFQQVVNHADLVTPDGMPLVWAMRLLGVKKQERVYGPDLTLHVAQAAARQGIPVGLYGGTPQSLEGLANNLRLRFPTLQIVYRYSPPFRPLTDAEDEQAIAQIHASGARIMFIGLGCPKQERWMAEHKDRISAVLLGVGAAFDIHSGQKPQAPHWMQRAGLEWLFRLANEPRRLWQRYIYHNPRFLVLIALQLLRHYKTRETPS